MALRHPSFFVPLSATRRQSIFLLNASPAVAEIHVPARRTRGNGPDHGDQTTLALRRLSHLLS
jgi:hypothetical protein